MITDEIKIYQTKLYLLRISIVWNMAKMPANGDKICSINVMGENIQAGTNGL